jgi:alcohol dehydrogenase class IV
MERCRIKAGGCRWEALCRNAFATAGTAAVMPWPIPWGESFNIPHGEANTVMLKSVMEFDRDRCAKKTSRLARAVSMERLNMSDEEASNT